MAMNNININNYEQPIFSNAAKMPLTKRWIPGFVGVYSATEDGTIWSHRNTKGNPRKKPIALKSYDRGSKPSYKAVRLTDGKHHYVHRLILEAFVGPVPAGKQVDHLNGIRNDNRLENLEYKTPSENNRNKRTYNKLGQKFIYPARNRFQVIAKVNGKLKAFGSRKTIEEAIKLRTQIMQQHPELCL